MHKRLRFWIIHECKKVKLRAQHDDIFETSHIFIKELICIFDENKCFIQVNLHISICKSINNFHSDVSDYGIQNMLLCFVNNNYRYVEMKINIQLYFL